MNLDVTFSFSFKNLINTEADLLIQMHPHPRVGTGLKQIFFGSSIKSTDEYKKQVLKFVLNP